MSNLAKSQKNIYIIQEFLEHLKIRNYTEQTIISMRSRVRYFFRYTGLKQNEVRKKDIERFYGLKLMRGTSPARVKAEIETLRVFFRWLEREGKILFSPAKEVETPRPEKKIGHVLTEEETKRLLDNCKGHTENIMRDRAILEVMYSTGMRKIELHALNVEDVDLEHGYVRITAGKGQKDRIVPLGQKAVEALKDYLAIKRERPRERALFGSSHPTRVRRMSKTEIGRMLRARGEAAGLKVSPHVLRRSCATHMLRAGASVMHVKELLGHSSMEVLDSYVKLAAKDIKDAHRKYHPRERKQKQRIEKCNYRN